MKHEEQNTNEDNFILNVLPLRTIYEHKPLKQGYFDGTEVMREKDKDAALELMIKGATHPLVTSVANQIVLGTNRKQVPLWANPEIINQERLADYQVKGIKKFKLSPEDVSSENFKPHTSGALEYITKGTTHPEVIQAVYQNLKGLNKVQARGVSHYMLSREQVQSENYGSHTEKAIDQITVGFINDQKGIQHAFNKVKGLNKVQAEAYISFIHIEKSLKKENFEPHILDAMLSLIKTERARSPREAYNMVKGLGKDEVNRMVRVQEHIFGVAQNSSSRTLNPGATVHVGFIRRKRSKSSNMSR
jgi:hypothetical protein